MNLYFFRKKSVSCKITDESLKKSKYARKNNIARQCLIQQMLHSGTIFNHNTQNTISKIEYLEHLSIYVGVVGKCLLSVLCPYRENIENQAFNYMVRSQQIFILVLHRKFFYSVYFISNDVFHYP